MVTVATGHMLLPAASHLLRGPSWSEAKSWLAGQVAAAAAALARGGGGMLGGGGGHPGPGTDDRDTHGDGDPSPAPPSAAGVVEPD